MVSDPGLVMMTVNVPAPGCGMALVLMPISTGARLPKRCQLWAQGRRAGPSTSQEEGPGASLAPGLAIEALGEELWVGRRRMTSGMRALLQDAGHAANPLMARVLALVP